MNHFVITIDGPAGSGKSTVAKALAKQLGIHFLDTGSLYRAVTYVAIKAGLLDSSNPLEQSSQIEELLKTIELKYEPGKTFVNDIDVSNEIRTEEVTSQIGDIASNPKVREFVNRFQKHYSQNHSLVTEGRDQGTLVYPDAPVKFFLTADSSIRANRRMLQYQESGIRIENDKVHADLVERDQTDQNREIAPLKPANDAILIDSSNLSFDDVIERMLLEIRKKINN